MTPECTHILPNGQKCRGLAGSNQPFCRHHRPKNAPPSGRRRNSRSMLAHWRATGRDLSALPHEELAPILYNLLQCLTQPRGLAPSDRTVGHYLRIILTRLGQVPFAAPFPDEESELPQPATAETISLAPSATSPGMPTELAQLQRDLTAMLGSLSQGRSR
ncbi:MAG: hypothetical protein WBW84_14610 [Acidobacteriaceae bacterium]